MEVCKSNVDLYKILSQIESIFNYITTLKGLKFSIDAAKIENPAIYTDERRLKQILFNILSNAIKFTKTGTVTLTVQRSIQNHINFSVTDSGIGMNSHKVASLSSLFETIDEESDRTQGIGFGTYITKQLLA